MTVRKLAGPAITGLLAAAILSLSLTPKPIQLPTEMANQDKVEHVIAYFSLAFSAFLALRKEQAGARFLLVVLGCSLYGGIIEILQNFVGRQMEFLDFVADAVGSGLGSVAAMYLLRLRGKTSSATTGQAHEDRTSVS
jgi:VanZ family protein